MSVSNSIVDFFQGNPFSNPVGSRIEKATECKNETEDWALIMETCDIINSTEDGPQLAIRAFKRRLTSDIQKNKASVLFSLILLETCVKNCGHRFHLAICNRDFLQELEKIVLNSTSNKQTKTEIPVVIRDRILLLIQTWFDSFRGEPDLREIVVTYKYLRESGVEFPMTDLVAMSPINTPKRSVPSSKTVTQEISTGKTNVPNIIEKSKTRETATPTSFIDKLANNLLLVQTNIVVLGELMQDYPPHNDVGDDAICLMKNLEATCQEMQTRLVDLINRWDEVDHKGSSVLFDLLRVNDEINTVLIQYERYERSRVSQYSKNIQENESIEKMKNSTFEELLAVQQEENVSENELIDRISKSNLADVYAAQHEVTDFYKGFSRIKSSSVSKGGVINETTNPTSAVLLVNQDSNPADSPKSATNTDVQTNVERKTSAASKRTRNNQDLFEL